MAGMTKEIIIQTVMELLNERPFTKITVKDIVERCGINRNTFYYHFRDITDVMEYAFKRELDRIMQAAGQQEADSRTVSGKEEGRPSNTGQVVQETYSPFHLDGDSEDIYDGLLKVVELLQENRRAILHIYRYMDRAVLQHHLDTLCEYIVSNYVLRARGYVDIQKLSGEDQRLMRNFQKCILEGVLLDWLEHGMKEDLASGMKRVLELTEEVPGVAG
ncbi:MAG: TetR/AcrR family transcriptional regulator [Lachnospiraceae bacterium]|nr:TetR/AcrR family transcriptional regulator [Lachnospiraceae bacterium]